MSAIIPFITCYKNSVGTCPAPDTHFTNGSTRNRVATVRMLPKSGVRLAKPGYYASLSKLNMQCDSGLLGWLKVPFLYNAFQAAVGATALRRRLIENHVRAKPGDKVIDIGCGSAPTLQSLPDVEYVGLDINPDCIALAQR